MNNTMTITLDTNKPGEQAVFQIEFAKSDFFAVVDQIDNVTLANVYNQKLFNVVGD